MPHESMSYCGAMPHTQAVLLAVYSHISTCLFRGMKGNVGCNALAIWRRKVLQGGMKSRTGAGLKAPLINSLLDTLRGPAAPSAAGARGCLGLPAAAQGRPARLSSWLVVVAQPIDCSAAGVSLLAQLMSGHATGIMLRGRSAAANLCSHLCPWQNPPHQAERLTRITCQTLLA